MKKITFQNIFTRGHVIVENACYRQIHYPEMLMRYDSNFIEFKRMPTVETFKEVEGSLREYHLKHGQNHLKFYFPENQQPTEEIQNYLKENGYSQGFLELYGIKPQSFPVIENNPAISIHTVTKETLAILQQLKYQNDLAFGREFADKKANLIKKIVDEPNVQQLLAFYEGQAVGYVDLILSKDTVEIDELSVSESYQKKGVGSHLQRFAMDHYPDKMIILVADGEDTPREMYQKQQYHYFGFQYEVLKEC